MKRYVLGISGASGSIIGVRVLEGLIRAGAAVHLVLSHQAVGILRHECGLDWGGDTEDAGLRVAGHLNGMGLSGFELHLHSEGDFNAPIASGSYRTDGMFIVPCSMKTLSGVANGYAVNLIERAADVTIKEGRPLLLSPREMPMSAIHLENMLKLSRIGVRIAPPVPGFYQRPETLDDIIDFMAGRILDAFGVGHVLYKRWGGGI